MSTARTRSTRSTAIAAGLLAAVALAACGSNDTAEVAAPQGAGESSTAGGGEGIDAAHNDVDAMFVSGMIPHHEGAVSMAELAEERAQSPEVKDLARRIAAAQEPEIELMQEMAAAWDVELDEGGGHAGHSGMDSHSGMDMGDDTAALEGREGAEFDRAFLTSMIEHHEGAIPMSREVLDEGENPQAKKLAAQIIDVQEREIAEMEQLLTEL